MPTIDDNPYGIWRTMAVEPTQVARPVRPSRPTTTAARPEFFESMYTLSQSTNGLTWHDGTLQAVSNLVAPPTLRQRRNKEKASLEEFMQTGKPSGLKMYRNGDGLCALGAPINDRKFLFTLDRQKIVALASRTKHLRKSLMALADREGLKLSFTEEQPPLEGASVAVCFWVFDNLDVDDSGLMVARPAQQPVLQPDRCDCGDPECEFIEEDVSEPASEPAPSEELYPRSRIEMGDC